MNYKYDKCNYCACLLTQYDKKYAIQSKSMPLCAAHRRFKESIIAKLKPKMEPLHRNLIVDKSRAKRINVVSNKKGCQLIYSQVVESANQKNINHNKTGNIPLHISVRQKCIWKQLQVTFGGDVTDEQLRLIRAPILLDSEVCDSNVSIYSGK